jgi:hypothetical protein
LFEKKVTVWNKNEPNNYQSSEQCVEIIANTGPHTSSEHVGRLNDIPCTKPTLGVICQMKGRVLYFCVIILMIVL